MASGGSSSIDHYVDADLSRGVHVGGPFDRRPSRCKVNSCCSDVPLNALLAAFTLLMWLLVWLGFGWVHRLEWLFTGDVERAHPRHAKDPDE